jgi:hypothetical protein
MSERLAVLLLSATVASGAGAFAQAPPGTGQIDKAVSIDRAQSTRLASTTLRMRGTIDRYDASTRMLTLSTSNGLLKVPLASTARIRQGWQTIEPLELEKLVGHRAVIRYSESGGNKTVESIHVFGRGDRTAR